MDRTSASVSSQPKTVENEIKLELTNVGATRRRITDLGAVNLGTEYQKDTYFQRPNPKDRILGENIRVREVVTDGDRRYGYFTYKSPLDRRAQFLRRDEFETKVDDPKMVLQTLDKLGYDIIDEIAKRRERHRLDELHIGIDQVEGVGDFIEIEGTDNAIKSLVRQLGLNPDDAINKSYSALRDERRVQT